MKTWFISDTHFGHTNIIKFKDRPFANADDMDEEMIKRWNSRVSPDDIVYHLGDFTYHKQEKAEEILKSLNGNKTLILGNHDQVGGRLLGWSQVTNYKEIKLNGQRIVMFHYPMVEWNNYYRGAWHLHGHVHGTRPDPDDKFRLDMAVENLNYYPMSFDEVQEVMNDKEIVY